MFPDLVIMRRPRRAGLGVLSPRRAPNLGKIRRRACLRLIPFPGTGDVLLAPTMISHPLAYVAPTTRQWFFLPRAWLLRRNRPQWGFVELLRCLTQTWCQMDDASPRWPINAHGCASWLRRLVKLINFRQKTSCLPSVLFACYAQRWYPSSVHLGCVGDAVVFHVGAILSHNWLWTKCFLEEGSTLVLRA